MKCLSRGGVGGLLALVAVWTAFAERAEAQIQLPGIVVTTPSPVQRPRRARAIDPPGGSLTAHHGWLITEIPGSSLPRAVVFRDSFVSALAPFLSEHFSRVAYAWQKDFDAPLVQRERADVVIQEIASRHLYTFTPSPELIPEQ